MTEVLQRHSAHATRRYKAIHQLQALFILQISKLMHPRTKADDKTTKNIEVGDNSTFSPLSLHQLSKTVSSYYKSKYPSLCLPLCFNCLRCGNSGRYGMKRAKEISSFFSNIIQLALFRLAPRSSHARRLENYLRLAWNYMHLPQSL